MLKTLTLTCYRSVLNDTIHFTEGLNAIRGANEASKSTRLEAIGYALYGSSALAEPLSDVVTYGHKETELKVELTYSHAGVDYVVKRGKSGAEITFGNNKITGQTETKKFNEQLFGATADLAGRLMIASQAKVRGALDGGASAPANLIESLANFDMIDTLVELVQSKLPYGSTAAIDSELIALDEQLAKPVIDNTAEAAANVAAAEAALADCEAKLEKLGKQPDSQPLFRELEQVKGYERRASELRSKIETLKAHAAQPLPAGGDAGLLEQLRAELATAQETNKVARLYNDWEERANKAVEYLQMPLAEVEASASKLKKSLAETADKLGKVKVEIATVTGQLIKEGLCPLCDLDLSTVPAVLSKNLAVSRQLQTLETTKVNLQSELLCMNERLTVLDAAMQAEYAQASLYRRYGAAVQILEGTTPTTSKWVGPAEELVEATLLAGISEEQAAITKYSKAKQEQDLAVSLLASAVEELESIPTPVGTAVADLQQKIAENSMLSAAIVEAQIAKASAAGNLQTARSGLEAAKSAYATAMSVRSQQEARRKELPEMAAEIGRNTALVKKLRGARPQIATKLWTSVMAVVSNYFSSIRGKVSTVTMADGGFKVDGHPLAGLSGSTKDALGLAIRMALTKTFLPNCQFLILDEVAAGMDDTREAALLAMVATCGFGQVIFVTHSELADSFADTVISI